MFCLGDHRAGGSAPKGTVRVREDKQPAVADRGGSSQLELPDREDCRLADNALSVCVCVCCLCACMCAPCVAAGAAG